jgi:6-hydroxymethylpterin diphosphokinase MptE-like
LLAANIDRISELIPSEGFVVTHAEPREPWHDTHLDFEALDLDGIEVLYVIGVGDGSVVQRARHWLMPDHRLVILAEEVEVMRWLLERVDQDSQIEVHPLCPDEGNDPLFHWLLHRYGLSEIGVAITPGYDGEAVERRLRADAARARLVYGEHLDYGRPFFENLWPNARLLPESFDAQKLFGCYEGVPAIICGAGPSLAPDQLDHDRALILAGGSALKRVRPHSGAAIDPNHAEQQILASAANPEVPLFFRTRLNHRALAAHEGPRLFVSGSSYEAGQWLDAQLGIADSGIDEGINVITFLTGIAAKLGCNPIIFSGVDLSVRDDVPEEALLDFDVRMRLVYTTPEWQTAAGWLGAFAEAHPEITFVNASEGIAIPGVEHIPLDEIDLGPPREIQVGPFEKLDVSADQVHWASQAMADSLVRAERFARQDDPLSQFELEEEISYNQLLAPLIATYRQFERGDPLAFSARAARINRQWIANC